MFRHLKLLATVVLLCLINTPASSFTIPSSFSIRTTTTTTAPFSPRTPTLLSAGPATLDKTKADKKASPSKEKQRKKDKGWEIRLYNDPFNKREFVARCLMTITGVSDGAAYQIMMQAHEKGIGVVGRYHLERAESYLSSLKSEGLMVDMIPAGD